MNRTDKSIRSHLDPPIADFYSQVQFGVVILVRLSYLLWSLPNINFVQNHTFIHVMNCSRLQEAATKHQEIQLRANTFYLDLLDEDNLPLRANEREIHRPNSQ